MNYARHYQNLIDRAGNRSIAGYVERHHVVPRCIGGTDEESNMVSLTPEEHYVAHQLLVKIYPHERGLLWAVMIMTGGRDHQPRKNKLYGWLRRRVSAEMTGKPKSPETRAKLSAALKGRLYSAERCANISAGKTGRKIGPCSDVRRARISAANTGKSPSLETRAKMRAAKLGKKLTAEHISKVVAANTGKKRSKEMRENMVLAWERRRTDNRL